MLIYPSIFTFPSLSLHCWSTTMHLRSDATARDCTHMTIALALLDRSRLFYGHMTYDSHIFTSILSISNVPPPAVRWWVYPSNTLLWPSIFDFLSFSLHRRSSDIYCADATFSDLRANLRDHRRLYPIPIAPSVRYHVGDLSYDLQTTLLHFPFLVFSPYPMQSFAVRPIADRRTTRSGPYHTLRRTQTLCSFYLLFVFITFVSTPKNKEVFPQNSDLSLSRLIVSLHSVFAPSHLRTFVPFHTSKTLRCIAPSRTSVSHHFALLDTTSGDHFTAPESHPSGPHRIYT